MSIRVQRRVKTPIVRKEQVDNDEPEERKFNLPILRYSTGEGFVERYKQEIHEIYSRASEVCVGGGGLFDGVSSQACVAAMLMLAMQTDYREGLGCIVLHSKEEVETLNAIKKRLFPENKNMQMVVVEFEELEKDFEETVPDFAQALSKELRIVQGGGRALGRVKRLMKEQMDKVRGARDRLFSPCVPYPQTIAPILESESSDDKFHIYAYHFSYLIVVGMPDSELQVHAINCICADTRWVSPYSLSTEFDNDRIEEDRETLLTRMPYMVALSNNQVWAKDLSVFHPWPSEDERLDAVTAQMRRNMAEASAKAYVVQVPPSFWTHSSNVGEMEKHTRNRKSTGPVVEDLTGKANLKHYMFMISMPNAYHEVERKMLCHSFFPTDSDGNPKRLKYSSQLYRTDSTNLVALTDEFARLEQVQILLREFSRYDLNRTAIVTSSQRIRKFFLRSRSLHPGLRVVRFDHSSLRRKLDIDTVDKNGNPLPPVERVVITDPFSLSERPARRIFSAFGNDVVFTWVVSRHGVDKLFATHLMSIPYNYEQIYKRTSRILLEDRVYEIFRKSAFEYLDKNTRAFAYADGHYFDQESSYHSSHAPSSLELENTVSILPAHIEGADMKCIQEGNPLYRIHLPGIAGFSDQKWTALPAKALQKMVEFMEACTRIMTAHMGKLANEATKEYRATKRVVAEFSKSPGFSLKTVHRPRKFVVKNVDDAEAYSRFENLIFHEEREIRNVNDMSRFLQRHLDITTLCIERKRGEEVDLIPLDSDLLYFAVQNKHSIVHSTYPSVDNQLCLSAQFSTEETRKKENTLYLMASATLHALSVPAFDKESGHLCLITVDDGLMGYTNRKHARSVLKTMVTESQSSQWLAFSPDYALPMIKKLFSRSNKEIEVQGYALDYAPGWNSIVLQPAHYTMAEKRSLEKAFVEAEDRVDDRSTFVISTEDAIRVCKRKKQRPQQNLIVNVASTPSSSSVTKSKTTSSVVAWREAKEKEMTNSSFSTNDTRPTSSFSSTTTSSSSGAIRKHKK